MQRQFFEASQVAEVTRNTTGAVVACTLNFTPDANRDYVVMFSADLQQRGHLTAPSPGAHVRFMQGTNFGRRIVWRANDANPGDDWVPIGSIYHLPANATPTELSFTLEIEDLSTDTSIVTAIKNIQMIALRLEEGDHILVGPNLTHGSTTFTDGVSLTFTPATPGDYLILGSCDFTHLNATPELAVRLLLDGVEYGLTHRVFTGIGDAERACFLAGKKLSLDTTQHTFKIQGRRVGAATGSANFVRPTIVALRLDLFDSSANNYVASVADSDGIEDDGASITQTVAEESLLIALGNLKNSGTVDEGNMRLLKDGVVQREWNIKSNSANNHYCGFALIRLSPQASAVYKTTVQREGTQTSTLADSTIALLQLNAGDVGGGVGGGLGGTRFNEGFN